MAQVVEPQGGETDLGGQALEITVDVPVGQTTSQLVCKHQPGFLPAGAGLEPPQGLFLPLAAQSVHHKRGWGDLPALAVFRGHQALLFPAAAGFQPLKLLVDQQGAPGKVHMVPGQAKDFALPHPRKKGYKEDSLIGVALDSSHKAADGDVIHGFQRLVLHSGQGAGLGGIEPQVADGHGLLERFVEDAMDQADRLRGERFDILGFRLEQTVIERLNVRGVQRLQFDGSHGGLDVVLNIALVSLHCPGLYTPQIGFLPNVHPLAQGHFAWLQIGAPVKFAGDLAEPLSYFLLRFPGHRFLLLLSCAGVEADGEPGLPVGVLPTVAEYGFLADRSGAGGVFLGLFAARHNNLLSPHSGNQLS